jgi:hypothetical protein
VFVADRLIYLQLQKTGCSHIARVLAETIGGRQVGKHNRLPDDASRAGRRIVGSVRNPWAWYVSLWAFGASGQGSLHDRLTSRSLVRALRGTWRRPFAAPRVVATELAKPVERWRASYAREREPDSFRQWLRALLDVAAPADAGEGYRESAVARCAGFMTYRYLWLYSRSTRELYDPAAIDGWASLEAFDRHSNLLDFVIRAESLEDDLENVLTSVGHELSPEQSAIIRSGERSNASSHGETAFYYDAETSRLVAERERLLIEKYRYEPPTLEPSPSLSRR